MIRAPHGSWVIAAMLTLCGCAASPAGPVLITDAAMLDAHIGRRVTLRGRLATGKGCRVLGVNVRTTQRNLHGRMVEANGVLVKHSFSQTGSAFDSVQMPSEYWLYESRSQSTRAQIRPYPAR